MLGELFRNLTQIDFLDLLGVEFAIGDISLGFTEEQGDDKGHQGQGNHLFEIILAFVHQLGQVQQVFTVSESHFDFHAVLDKSGGQLAVPGWR